MKKYFEKSAKIALVLVYLVIFAGAFVRLTGSGMGCPDWPKCFGYYIPPTQEKELLFASGKEYDKGQVIIKDETLWVANKDFTANKTYITHSTLKAVEEKVTPGNFIKVHRSYIVNLRKIKDIQDNSLVIEGKVIPISKSLRPEVMLKIGI